MTRPRRRSRSLFVDNLEKRELLTVAVSSVPAEIYTWNLVNSIRANPTQFANDIEALAANRPGTYGGYSSSDPVWSELRSEIAENPAGSGWSLSTPLNFLRAQPSLPTLFLQDDLSARASDHTQWMLQHGFAHTGVAAVGPSIAGFSATAAAAPDQFNHDPSRYLLYTSENIAYGYNSQWPFEAAAQTGQMSTDAYVQRLAYVATMNYVLDIGQPDLGHLRNLFGRPDGVSDGLTGPLPVYPIDSIGIDASFASVFNGAGLPDEYISTMRFDNVRDNSPKLGQWSGLSFTDTNGNGQFDMGEPYQLLATTSGNVVNPPAAGTPVVTPVVTTPGTSSPTTTSTASTATVGPVATSVGTASPQGAPQVVGFRAVRTRQGLTAVVVQFAGSLDAATATSTGAYTLTGRRLGLNRTIRIRAAQFDLSTNSVTLILNKPFNGSRVRALVDSSIRSSVGVHMATSYTGSIS